MDQKSILRTEKNKKNPYVMINKNVFSDDRISWKAKGIMGYLLSKPDNWEIRISDLVNHAKDGRDSVLAGLKELKEFGYIIHFRERDEFGHMGASVYKVYEEPQIENEDSSAQISAPKSSKRPKTDFPFMAKNPETDFPELGNPELGNPELGNPTLINNESTKQEKSNKNELSNNREAESVVVDSVSKICEEVKQELGTKPGRKQVEKLLRDYGEARLMKTLEKVAKEQYVFNYRNSVGVWIEQCKEEWEMDYQTAQSTNNSDEGRLHILETMGFGN